MASTWRRCSSCRKVRAVSEFDGDAEVCTECTTRGSEPRRRSTAVRIVQVARVEPTVVQPVDQVGRGDREVRQRRARRAALDRLAEAFPEDFEVFLADARRAERLT